MKDLQFFKQFMKNWRSVGSITPSSKFLVKKMLSTINFTNAETIIELGAGSGIVTLELLEKMLPNSKLIVFETNSDFYESLTKISDSRLFLHNDSAVYLGRYLEGGLVDYIISGIPLATLSPLDKEELLTSSYKSLKSNGRYIQFQYSLESEKDLKKIFDDVSIDFTPLNIPPAFIFSCLKR